MDSAIHIVISGGVQGVFFRAGAQDQARKLNLSGWVRNTPDGSVEVLAEGGRNSLEQLLDWCYHGPAGASVSAIEYGWVEPKGIKEFTIRYD
ncbi:MAG: acylphosphatase [Candidatus ainarchaeum sp.]|nr:acylphosphatase [Candidatus ainarchaeum sp.]